MSSKRGGSSGYKRQGSRGAKAEAKIPSGARRVSGIDEVMSYIRARTDNAVGINYRRAAENLIKGSGENRYISTNPQDIADAIMKSF